MLNEMSNEDLLWAVRANFDAQNQAETEEELDKAEAFGTPLLEEMARRDIPLSRVPPTGAKRD